ncbi:MAG: S-adenosylmethionine decarboxylase [Nitrosopumilus sp.]
MAAKKVEGNRIELKSFEVQTKVPYGYELILDLHDCDPDTFNRPSIEDFFKKLCKQIKMTRCELHFWDDVGVPPEEQQTSPHTKGTSAVQFILTSTIVIHTLDLMGAVYINIFSCKEFDEKLAETFTKEWFHASEIQSHFIERL